MVLFRIGSFTTSTPIHKQHDSGFYENSLRFRNFHENSNGEDLESHLPLRKSLFGRRRRNDSENIPDCNFSQKHKLLLTRSIFPRRDVSSNGETPRASRICAVSDKSVHCTEAKTPRQSQQLFLNNPTTPLRHSFDNDSGFFDETPKRSRSPKSETNGIPLLQLFESLPKTRVNVKEESLAYFKNFLKVSAAKNFADLSPSEMLHLYYIYRFQKTGLKPPVLDIEFCEKHLMVNETNEESEMFLLSWKNRLEHIAPNPPARIDFLGHLHAINTHSIVPKILSYLSGRDLQSVSCVSRAWQEFVLKDKNANMARLHYLKEKEKKKLAKPFQRPPNFRTLGSIENLGRKQLHMKKTLKEINFEAFIEVKKSGNQCKPMKCPSCSYLSLQDKQVITKCICLFCGYEFCCSCLKPYSNWHLCSSPHLPVKKPLPNSKRYLRRL